MVNNMSGLQFGIMMIIAVTIGLIGGKYIKTLSPLNQSWAQYYLLGFVSILTIYHYWSKERVGCKCESGCGCEGDCKCQSGGKCIGDCNRDGGFNHIGGKSRCNHKGK